MYGEHDCGRTWPESTNQSPTADAVPKKQFSAFPVPSAHSAILVSGTRRIEPQIRHRGTSWHGRHRIGDLLHHPTRLLAVGDLEFECLCGAKGL